MTTRNAQLFGSGAKYPLKVDSAGRLVLTSGEDRLWDTVEAILDALLGTAPLDPEFGKKLSVYDVVGNAAGAAHDVADAIERSEPRVSAVDVEVVEVSAQTGTVRLSVTLTPIDTQVPTNRILNVYGLVE